MRSLITSLLQQSRWSLTRNAANTDCYRLRGFSSKAKDEISRWDPSVAVEGATTPPASWFTDPEIYKLEQEAVLAGNWVAVGRTDQLQGPSSYFSGVTGGEPWVVEGALRGYYNVCRHHAAQLTPLTGQGPLQRFQCPYHGWTYGLDGRLNKALRLKGIKDFRAKDFGLKPVAVAEFGPLVFMNLDPNKCPGDFAADFSEVHQRLSERNFNELAWVRRVEYPMRCNWKVFVDNYLDGGYHVEHLHPALTSNLDIGSYTTQVSPLYSLQEVGGRGDNRVGERALYIYMYPSLMINRYGPWMDTNMVIPTGPDTTTVVYDYFLQKDKIEELGEEMENYVTESLAESDKVQQEDNMICESVQRGLNSSAYDTGRYAPTVEMADHAFHQMLASQLRSKVGL